MALLSQKRNTKKKEAKVTRPRPYLSFSQMNLLERSERSYYDNYFLEKPKPQTKEMALGSKLSEAMETGIFTGDPLLDLVCASLPRLDKAEMEVTTVLGKGKDKIPLLCRLDNGSHDLSAVEEYKTGRTKWSQKVVDNDSQLTFYATAIWLKTKKIPRLRLTWAEAEIGPSGPRLTGKIQSFFTKRDMQQIIKMMGRMQKAWDTIGIMAKNHNVRKD